MRETRTLAWILLFGSLWGMNEVMTGEVLFRNQVFLSSVWLAAWAFFVLSVARGIANMPGTSAIIGAIAAGFRLVNGPPFYCHLLAIFLLGVGFDVAASLLLKKGTRSAFRQGLVGVLGAYGGYALFALIITYIVRYKYWVAGGSAKVLEYIFVDGSVAAVVLAFLVPLGYRAASIGWPALEKHPRWSSVAAAAGVIVLWILGQMMS